MVVSCEYEVWNGEIPGRCGERIGTSGVWIRTPSGKETYAYLCPEHKLFVADSRELKLIQTSQGLMHIKTIMEMFKENSKKSSKKHVKKSIAILPKPWHPSLISDEITPVKPMAVPKEDVMIILRYDLEEVPGVNQIRMPKMAKVLTAQWHPAKGVISLWVSLDEGQNSERAEDETRVFVVATTGGFFLDAVDEEAALYISTCQESQGTLVWHVFERLLG